MSKLLKRIFARVDISSIVNSHYATLYDNNKLQNEGITTIPRSDWVVFWLVPILISLVLTFFLGVRFNKDSINLLITSLSILIGLLLSLLVLLFDLGKKEKENLVDTSANDKIKYKFQSDKVGLVKEVFSNVLFSVLLSIFTIVFCLLTQISRIDFIYELLPSLIYECMKWLFLIIIHFISFFLLVQFILTLLMILKRFKILFDLEFK